MNEMTFILCVSGAVAAITYALAARLTDSAGDDRLRRRLSARGAAGAAEGGDAGAGGAGGAGGALPAGVTAAAIVPFLQRIGQAAAHPFMPTTRERQSGMRRNLARAGIYAPAATRLIVGGKVILLCLGLAVGYFVGATAESVLLGISGGGLLGYLLPNAWLRVRTQANQKALTHALPDGLDLMVVCVEAGLTIDAAIQRVGEELALAHPTLSRELGIAHMETRVGLSRAEALKNLGNRTGNPALHSLASMLAQADRFGTSVAKALRVHADALRIARQHAAEEMVAKASVKMSFPLVLFIFPASFMVIAGPTIVELLGSELFK